MIEKIVYFFKKTKKIGAKFKWIFFEAISTYLLFIEELIAIGWVISHTM